MNLKIGWKSLVVTLAMLGLQQNGWAEQSGAAFLNNNPDPQSYAMANSGVVTAAGAKAASANPSRLGMLNSHWELFSSFATMLGGERYGFLSGAVSVAPGHFVDGVGFSVVRQQVSGIDGADSLGNANGTSFGAADTAFGVSASAPLDSSLRAGLTFKMIQEQLAGFQSNTALAGDMGVSYHASFLHGATLGVGVNNVGQKIQFIGGGQKDNLPMSMHAAASVPFGPLSLVMSVNHLVYDKTTDFGLGMGYDLGIISFRAGFLEQGGAPNLAAKDQKGMSSLMNNMAGGIGLQLGRSARVDYAVSPQADGEYSATQRVALTLQFGNKAAERTFGGNTRVIERSPWQENQPDSIDWHMIRLENK